MTPQVSFRSLDARPLSVPLEHPFVIATAVMEKTEAVLMRATLEVEGRIVHGYGEAAALPPVTRETQATLIELGRAAAMADGSALFDADCDLRPEAIDRLGGGSNVMGAAIESALLDALARAAQVPLHAYLGSEEAPSELWSDITLGIAEPRVMVERALAFRARGFDTFKVKVGRNLEDDREAIVSVHREVPGARFRLDANEGFDARSALLLIDSILEAGCIVECFEQPCRRDDVRGMAEVTRSSAVPIIADESLRCDDDLSAILGEGLASGVNLKLVKLGGLRRAVAIGRRARREGLSVMAGAMVETKLGLTAMAHVIAALGGVEYVDLDTALLLREDPFEGGMEQAGPKIAIPKRPGLAIEPMF